MKVTTPLKPVPGKFVTGFIVIAWDNDAPPKNTETLIWIKTDANSNHGGKYVFIGMYYEQKLPVTSMDFLIQDDSGPRTPIGWESNKVDLNFGAGGKYIYIMWRKEESVQPIIRVKLVETRQSSPPYIKGWDPVNKDLTAGTGGSYIFAYYTRMHQNDLSTNSTR